MTVTAGALISSRATSPCDLRRLHPSSVRLIRARDRRRRPPSREEVDPDTTPSTFWSASTTGTRNRCFDSVSTMSGTVCPGHADDVMSHHVANEVVLQVPPVRRGESRPIAVRAQTLTAPRYRLGRLVALGGWAGVWRRSAGSLGGLEGLTIRHVDSIHGYTSVLSLRATDQRPSTHT